MASVAWLTLWLLASHEAAHVAAKCVSPSQREGSCIEPDETSLVQLQSIIAKGEERRVDEKHIDEQRESADEQGDPDEDADHLDAGSLQKAFSTNFALANLAANPEAVEALLSFQRSVKIKEIKDGGDSDIAKQLATAGKDKKMVQAQEPTRLTRIASLSAKLIVWAVGLALTIVFPPAALAIAGAQTLLGFLISCAVLRSTGKHFSDFTAQDWCGIFMEVGQNMLVGITGGTSGGAAIVLGYDVAEMIKTESTGTDGALSMACSIQWDYNKIYAEYEAARHEKAMVVLGALKTLNLNRNGCSCGDCDNMGTPMLCNDETCLPFYSTKCSLEQCDFHCGKAKDEALIPLVPMPTVETPSNQGSGTSGGIDFSAWLNGLFGSPSPSPK